MTRRYRVPLTAPSPRAAGRLVLLPLTLILCVTTLDLLAPPEVHLGPLLVAAPAVTSSFAGPRLTAVVAALAIAGQVLIAVVRNSLTSTNHLTQIAALVAVSTVVVLYCRLRETRDAELSQVRAVADATQQVLLKPPPPRLGPLTLAVAYEAAAEEARIGGDLYAVVRRPGATRLAIGDVRGKGLRALDETALILGAFRAAPHHSLSLPELAAQLDGALSRHVASDEARTEDFATAALIDIPDDGDGLTLFSCGHPPPYVVSSRGVRALETEHSAPPLGMASLSSDQGQPRHHAFSPGEVLLLYTDGIIEARNGDGAFYPLEQRLAHLHTALSPGSPQTVDALVRALFRDLAGFTGGSLEDDAALLAVCRTET